VSTISDKDETRLTNHHLTGMWTRWTSMIGKHLLMIISGKSAKSNKNLFFYFSFLRFRPFLYSITPFPESRPGYRRHSRRGRQCRAARRCSAPLPPLEGHRHGCTGCTRKRAFLSPPTSRSTTSSMEAGDPNLSSSNLLPPPIITLIRLPSRSYRLPRPPSPSSSNSSGRRATPCSQTLALAIPHRPSRSSSSLP
jgi:hypothetical protein